MRAKPNPKNARFLPNSVAPTARAIAAAPSPPSACCSVAAAAPRPASSRRASPSALVRAEAEPSSSSSSSVGSESTVVSSDEIAAANAAGEGTGGGGGGSAEAAIWAATATASDPRVRFYVSMTLRHRWPVMWSDIILDRVAKGGYEVSELKLDNMVRGGGKEGSGERRTRER